MSCCVQARLCDAAGNFILGVANSSGTRYYNWPELTPYTLGLTPYKECYGHEIHLKAGEDIGDAVDALPAEGGKITLASGFYESPWQDQASANERENIQIVGCQAPVFSEDYRSLKSGSIIRGSFWQGGSGRSLKNVGIDVGAEFCQTEFGGAAQEGLIFRDPYYTGRPVDEWQNLHLDNIFVVCHEFNSDVHAMLLENYCGGTFQNLYTAFGGAGIVNKSRRTHMRTTVGRNHSKYSVLNKSENYDGIAGFASAVQNTYHDMEFYGDLVNEPDVLNAAQFTGNGFVIQAANADAFDIRASRLRGRGVLNLAKVYTLDANQCRDVWISDGDSKYCHNAAIELRGNTFDTCVSKIDSKYSRHGVDVGPGVQDTKVSLSSFDRASFFAVENAGTNTQVSSTHMLDPGFAGARVTMGSLDLRDVAFNATGAQPRTQIISGTLTDQ